MRAGHLGQFRLRGADRLLGGPPGVEAGQEGGRWLVGGGCDPGQILGGDLGQRTHPVLQLGDRCGQVGPFGSCGAQGVDRSEDLLGGSPAGTPRDGQFGAELVQLVAVLLPTPPGPVVLGGGELGVEGGQVAPPPIQGVGQLQGLDVFGVVAGEGFAGRFELVGDVGDGLVEAQPEVGGGEGQHAGHRRRIPAQQDRRSGGG